MEVKILNGDLTTSGVNVIAQQVNCLGATGGLAWTMRQKFPKEYVEYKALVDKNINNHSSLLGTCQMVQLDSEHYVANLFGQDECGTDKCYTNYDALKECLVTLKNNMLKNPNLKTVGFPWLIGCGLAGGDWNIVKPLIEGVFSDTDIEIQYWKY